MASYGYEALNNLGKTVKGSIEADQIEIAKERLKQQGLIVMNIKEQSVLDKDISFTFLQKKPSPRDLGLFCRQFVSMSRAGVTILECLRLLQDQTENDMLRLAVAQVHADVQKGESLADALKKHPKVFSSLMVTTVAAGEESGSLEVSLERMAEQFEKSAKTKALVKKAMVYPVMVLIVALIVVIVMLTVVIPGYMEMFEDMGTELPGITKMVVAMSDFIIGKWFILLPIVIAIAIAITTFFSTPTGKRISSTTSLKVPAIKNLVEKSACSQLARTLSTLIAAGVPLVDAVEITASTMQNVLYREAMMIAKDEVMKGVPLSEPLEQCGLFPSMLFHMIRIGEEAGNTEEMLTKLADYYDEEVEMATQGLMDAMQPMIILVLAVIVCGILGAVMAPMMTMYEGLDNL